MYLRHAVHLHVILRTAFFDALGGRAGVRQGRGGQFVIGTPSKTALILLGAREANAAEEQKGHNHHRELAGDFCCDLYQSRARSVPISVSRHNVMSYTFGMCSTSRYESTHDAGRSHDAVHETTLRPSRRIGLLVCQ